MPLRRPERLPAELSELLAQAPPASLRDVPAAPLGVGPSPQEQGGVLRRVLTMRISLWQAAAAAAVLLALQTGLARLASTPQAVAPPSGQTNRVLVSLPQPPEPTALADLARLPTAARRDFWTVPASARRQGGTGLQLIRYQKGDE